MSKFNLCKYIFVFDFDGPLFNGREAAQKAIDNTLAHFEKKYGRPEFNFSYIPLFDPKRIIAIFYSQLNLEQKELDEIEKYYSKLLIRNESFVQINPSLKNILVNMYEQGNKFALFSSRPKKILEQYLSHLGIKTIFSIVIGGDSALNPKPHPEGLYKIAEHFRVETQNLILIGDSSSDYKAAEAAGALYYHASWTGEPNNVAFRKAKIVLNDLGELIEVLDSVKFPIISQKPSIPEDLKQAIDEGDFSFYGGAGISIPSGLGDWDNQYRPIFQHLQSTLLTKDLSYTEALQLIAANFEQSKKVFDMFSDSFENPDIPPNAYHFAMLRSGAQNIWTSNYDQLFEKADTLCGFGRKIIANDRMLLENFRNKKLVIKMNGDFSNATFNENYNWEVVILQKQFDLADRQRVEIWRMFEDDYRNRCIVFVGLSFTDPALRRIISVARQKISRTRYNHYFLAKTPSDPLREKRFRLHADNLKHNHIHTIFFENFSDITKFVKTISALSLRPVVGFSGNFFKKINDDGSYDSSKILRRGKLRASKVEKFCSTIGRELALKGYRITSGGAPVVGIPAVIAAFDANPSLSRFYMRRHSHRGFIRSAPVIIVPGETYQEMRKQFISEVSLLIAIAGIDGNERKSGTISEIVLALNNQIPVILIPQAGGAVALYWNKFINKLEHYYPDHQLCEKICTINKEIASIPVAQLIEFAGNQLPSLIDELIYSYMGSSCKQRPYAEQW